MRAVFFGTPAIAVPALRALQSIAQVVAVVCQPDRPSGRGLKVHAPPIKLAAVEMGVPVHQPTAVRTGALATWLEEQRADLVLVMAYGRILPTQVLETPRHGSLNLHASLLPRYRGAAPIQWAILQGETETGISLMRMDAGMDTGPVYCERSLPIGPAETAGQLADRLSELAAEVTRGDVPRVVSGELKPVAQDHHAATHAPPLDRSMSSIDWSRPSRVIVNLVRAMAPRPGAHTTLRGKHVKLLDVGLSTGPAAGPPGTVTLSPPETLRIATVDGALDVHLAQLEGKRAASARDLINGRALQPGDCLGS